MSTSQNNYLFYGPEEFATDFRATLDIFRQVQTDIKEYPANLKQFLVAMSQIRSDVEDMDDMTIYNLMNNIAGGVMSVSSGFVPENIGWVQYSAIHDARTCPYCRRLDGMLVSVSHEDYVSGKYDPPQHPNCRCTWVQIDAAEPDVEEDWNPPDASEMASHAAENPALMNRLSFSRAWAPFIADIEEALGRGRRLNF